MKEREAGASPQGRHRLAKLTEAVAGHSRSYFRAACRVQLGIEGAHFPGKHNRLVLMRCSRESHHQGLKAAPRNLSLNKADICFLPQSIIRKSTAFHLGGLK